MTEEQTFPPRIKNGIEYVQMTPREIAELQRGDSLFIFDSCAVVLPAIFESHSPLAVFKDQFTRDENLLRVEINGRICGAFAKHFYKRTPDRASLHELTDYDS